MPGNQPNIGDTRVIKACPLCQTQYNPWQAQVLEERRDAHLVHVKCQKCGSAQVALILAGAVGVSTIGLITDLTPTDVIKFKDSDFVEVDDIMEIHQMLEENTFSITAYN
ncbi:MAG: hypothetical protein V1838_01635 [Patescibacteria group bacterium]